MQTRPDQPTLLEAITRFLLEELSPRLGDDKALQFRVLIAANLSTLVASELRTEAGRFKAEAERLAAVLESPVPADAAGLEALNQTLASKLRSGQVDEAAALQHLLETAKETLAVTNPRFDLSDDP